MPEFYSADTAKNQQQIIFHLQFSRVRLLYSAGQFDCSVIIRNFLLISIVRLVSNLHFGKSDLWLQAQAHNRGIGAMGAENSVFHQR